MAADVLRWTDRLPAEETTKAPVAIEIADAMSLQKHWTRLRRWTHNGSWGEDDYLRLGYQAYATRQIRQHSSDAEFGSLWQAAERACDENAEHQIRLARLASRWNLQTQSEQLWLRVAHYPLTRRQALDALFDIYRSSNDLPNLYLTAMRLHETAPNEAIVAAEYARLSLLLDRDIKEGQRVAQEAFDQARTEPFCVVVQALSLYSLGRANDGIELLKKLPPEKLHEPRAAVYTAVLLLSQGQSDSAREFVAAANAGPIFPEEKKFLQEAQQRSEATPSRTPVPSVTPSQTPSSLSPR